jgi:hypothetical protein
MVLLALFSTFPWLNGRTARVGVPPSPQLHTGTETREGTSETNHPPITAHMGGTDYTYPGDVGSWRYRCRGQTCQRVPTSQVALRFATDERRNRAVSGFLGDSSRQASAIVEGSRVPDKDEVPGSNPGRPTPRKPRTYGVFAVLRPSGGMPK